jgi:RNase P protein component
MLFMLATKRNLLARSSRELFSKFPDLAVALGIVIALLPQAKKPPDAASERRVRRARAAMEAQRSRNARRSLGVID